MAKGKSPRKGADSAQSTATIYEFDVVRTERAHNPRLMEKIAREGVPIYPE